MTSALYEEGAGWRHDKEGGRVPRCDECSDRAARPFVAASTSRQFDSHRTVLPRWPMHSLCERECPLSPYCTKDPADGPFPCLLVPAGRRAQKTVDSCPIVADIDVPIGRPLTSRKRHIVGRSKCRPGSAVKINLSRLMHYSQVLCITVQAKTMPFIYYYTRHMVDGSILRLQLTLMSQTSKCSPPGATLFRIRCTCDLIYFPRSRPGEIH